MGMPRVFPGATGSRGFVGGNSMIETVTVAGSQLGRRWTRLGIIIFVAYSLAYIDRANYGFGAAAGLAADLKITADASSLLGALFFLGYFIFQVPGAHYAENQSARRLIFWSLVLWGLLSAGMGLITNIWLLYIDRFLLGVAESAVLPGMIVLLSHWFTRPERSRANNLVILGAPLTLLYMSVLSGYLIQYFGWRGMFIIEGLPAVLVAFIWLRLVDDSPRQAAWLPATERDMLEAALRDEQTDITPVRNYAQAFCSPVVVLLLIQNFCWVGGVLGFLMWLPTILKQSSAFSMVGIGWLSAVPFLAAALASYGNSYFSDRSGHRKSFIWPHLLIGAAAFYGSYLVGSTNYWLSYALLVVVAAALWAPYGPYFAFITEALPRNVAGGALGLINSFGALGSFAGTYLVGALNASTGGPGAAYLLMACGLVLSAVVTILVPVPTTRLQEPASRQVSAP
jgi:sugar phosphate permease